MGVRIFAALASLLVGVLLYHCLVTGVMPMRFGKVRHAEHPGTFWYCYTVVAAFEAGCLWVAFFPHR